MRRKHTLQKPTKLFAKAITLKILWRVYENLIKWRLPGLLNYSFVININYILWWMLCEPFVNKQSSVGLVWWIVERISCFIHLLFLYLFLISVFYLLTKQKMLLSFLGRKKNNQHWINHPTESDFMKWPFT